MNNTNSYSSGPDKDGHFGLFGGRYVAETLMPLILDLEQAYISAKNDPKYKDEMEYWLTNYVGRPSPLYHAANLTDHFGGAKIYFKRDELNRTGAHTVCALFNFPCTIYMGETDIERQQSNVFRIKLLGAKVVPVISGSKTLKDAMNEALRDWVANVNSTYYLIGTAAGPHPYPEMVRDFQSVIGDEVRQQILEVEDRLPDSLVACVGGGSNAIGLFHPFLDDDEISMIGVEAAGHGIETEQHAASLTSGRPGVLHGNRTYLLQDIHGQIKEAHSISAGLDYPGIGPEHSWLKDSGRVKYVAVTDKEALDAFGLCSQLEGIIPALEPAHALAYVKKMAPTLPSSHIIVMNMCGRGDKDIFTVSEVLEANK